MQTHELATKLLSKIPIICSWSGSGKDEYKLYFIWSSSPSYFRPMAGQHYTNARTYVHSALLCHLGVVVVVFCCFQRVVGAFVDCILVALWLSNGVHAADKHKDIDVYMYVCICVRAVVVNCRNGYRKRKWHVIKHKRASNECNGVVLARALSLSLSLFLPPTLTSCLSLSLYLFRWKSLRSQFTFNQIDE